MKRIFVITYLLPAVLLEVKVFSPYCSFMWCSFHQEYAVNFWLKKGIPRSKLVVGIPFYGCSFTLQYSNETGVGAPISGPGRTGYYTQSPGLLAYFETCDLALNEGWHQGRDSSGSPYLYNGDQWVGYDDIQSIEAKVSGSLFNLKLVQAKVKFFRTQ